MMCGRSSSRPARSCRVSSCFIWEGAWQCRLRSSALSVIDHLGGILMASALSYRRLVESVLAIVATAAMFYFGNGLDPLWPLMWFATLPVLLFALRSQWWAAAVTAVVAMMLGNLNLWSYFTKTLGMLGSAWVGIFFTASVVFAAGILLFRVLVLRGAAWSGLLALSAVWVTGEYVRNVTSP